MDSTSLSGTPSARRRIRSSATGSGKFPPPTNPGETLHSYHLTELLKQRQTNYGTIKTDEEQVDQKADTEKGADEEAVAELLSFLPTHEQGVTKRKIKVILFGLIFLFFLFCWVFATQVMPEEHDDVRLLFSCFGVIDNLLTSLFCVFVFFCVVCVGVVRVAFNCDLAQHSLHILFTCCLHLSANTCYNNP